MKKFIFTLVILLGAGLLVGISFLTERPAKDSVHLTVDVSEGEKLYGWNSNNKSFTEISLTGSKTGLSDFYYHRFSPVDGIYYRSNESIPFIVEKKGKTNIVTYNTGIFICNIQTGLEKFQFQAKDVIFTPKGRGSFLVDTTHDQVKIVSLGAFLDAEIIDSVGKERVVNFTLFPSLYFVHDPKNITELKNVDILRLSTLDSIYYVDLQNLEDRKKVFAGENSGADEVFFTEVQDDIKARTNALTAVYSAIIKQDDKQIQNIPFFDTTSSLFINNSKKAILLKNALVDSIVQAIRNPKKSQITTISDILSQMKDLNVGVYAEGLSILRKYYAIMLFSHTIETNEVHDFGIGELSLIGFIENIINTTTQQKQRVYYMELERMFSAHYFFSLKSEDLNHAFENSLQKILVSKTLSKEEFLPFAFFVTRYLADGSILPDENTLQIISHLIEITNQYYDDNKTDDSKIESITSTIFDNYTKIFGKLRKVFVVTFTNNNTSSGLLMKDEYVKGGVVIIDQGLKNSLAKIIDLAKADKKDKINVLSLKNLNVGDSQVIISRASLLGDTLAGFDVLRSMFTSYQKYLVDSKLDDESRRKGLQIIKGNELSQEKLTNYLIKFNNLDISTLKTFNGNTFIKDGFYNIQVTILGKIFKFKLTEEGHYISEISYQDISGVNRSIPDVICLDSKQKELEKRLESSDDPQMKYNNDFKNYFEIAFLKENSIINPIVDNTSKFSTGTSNMPEIQIFIQDKLLDNDFKNIVDFLPIGFQNIEASISSGTYLVELRNLNKNFKGKDNTYSLEIASKYIFNRHSFSRFTFRVKKESDKTLFDFNDTVIEVLPARISLVTLADSMQNLGYYIDAIKSSYTNQKSIIVDLVGKKVLLDNISFIPKFPVQ